MVKDVNDVKSKPKKVSFLYASTQLQPGHNLFAIGLKHLTGLRNHLARAISLFSQLDQGTKYASWVVEKRHRYYPWRCSWLIKAVSVVTLMGGLMLVVTEEARLHLGPAFSLVTSLFLFLPPSLVSFIFLSSFSFLLPIWCICCLLFGCILSYFQFIV